MKTNKIRNTMITLLLVTIFAQFAFIATGNNEVHAFKGENPIIIFDIAHQQNFNETHMQSALDFIETNFEAEVIINQNNFTFTNLRGADLIITPAPYYDAQEPYTEIERLAFDEYIQDGGAVLYLSNPYIYEEELRNYSSLSRSLNDFLMGDNFGILNFIPSKIALLNDFNYGYNDQRFLYLQNMTFKNEDPIISGRNSEKKVDEILTFTTYIYTVEGGERVINTTHDSYYLSYNDNELGEIADGSVGNHSILVSHEIGNDLTKTRAIACGSGIMFSDLDIPGANMTWYEAYDNAQLWENMIDWLLYQTPIVEEITPIPEFVVFALSILGIFVVLVVFGLIFYTAGREVKRAEVSETIQRMRDRRIRKTRTKEEDDLEEEEEEIEEEEKATKEKIVEEKEEPKEVEMESIAEEVKKKPPKRRSRSERRRNR